MVNTQAEGDVSVRRVDARRNYDRIVNVATTVLAEDPKATLQDIAVAAGLHRATLHRHFRSREELLSVLRARSAERMLAALDTVEAADVPTVDRMPLFTLLVLENAVPTGLWRFTTYYGTGMDEHMEEMVRRIVAILEESRQAGALHTDLSSEQLRAIWYGVVYGVLPLIDAGTMTMDEGVGLVMAALRPSAA